MQAHQRLERKINAIADAHTGDQKTIDRLVNSELTADECLTIALMPINSRLRTYVVGCLMRDSKRKKEVEALKEVVREEELVPVEVHGGGKCKITVYMTAEAAARERGR